MIRLDAATFLLQWSAGGLLFLWVTTRRREVGLGYGWIQRGVFALMAIGAVYVGVGSGTVAVRELSSAAVAASTLAVLGVSIARRSAGVAGQRAEQARKKERVAAMLAGGEGANPSGYAETGIEVDERAFDDRAKEFPPVLDLVPPVLAIAGLVAGGIHAAADGDELLSIARVVVGALFLGSVTDAMLLGHWYLVQPGLARKPLLELVRWTGLVWPLEVALLLVPTGMVSVWNGTIDDGYGGMLGWFWIACAIATIALVFVTRAALKERYYSAVMAATGLLYLAILTAFGTDLVARAVLAG